MDLKHELKTNKTLQFVLLLLLFSPIIFPLTKGFYNLVNDFGGFSKPTKTYYEVFLPEKKEHIIPHDTKFSRINTPIATYKIKNSKYKLLVFKVDLAENKFNPSKFFILKNQLPEVGSFKGIDLWNATKTSYMLMPRPTINSIEVHVNPKYPIQDLLKTNDFIYGRLSGDILLSFNQEKKRFLAIETTNIKVAPAPIEFLCFSKSNEHYMAFGVGKPPEGADEMYLQSIILENKFTVL